MLASESVGGLPAALCRHVCQQERTVGSPERCPAERSIQQKVTTISVTVTSLAPSMVLAEALRQPLSACSSILASPRTAPDPQAALQGCALAVQRTKHARSRARSDAPALQPPTPVAHLPQTPVPPTVQNPAPTPRSYTVQTSSAQASGAQDHHADCWGAVRHWCHVISAQPPQSYTVLPEGSCAQ